jgi:hypothetical protein
MLTTKEIRRKCTAVEMEKYVGFKYYPSHCIGVNPSCSDRIHCLCCCKRGGDHADHHWEDEIAISDTKTRHHAGRDEEYSSTIRWYNFQYALFISKNNVKEAIKYTKDNCFDIAGEPDYIPSKLGFPNYAKLLEYINNYTRELALIYPRAKE